MGRVVAAFAYRCGSRVAEIQLGDSAAWAREKGDFVWIGFHEPTEQDLRVLQAQFGLHELAIEDALSAHQVPKLEVYGDLLFVVLRTAQLDHGKVVFGETCIFVGEDYIISVRQGASQSYLPVRVRCEASPKLLTHGVDYVLHALLDFVVDNYMPVVAAAVEEVDAIEERLLEARLTRGDIERIYELRRELVRLRRVAAPMVEVCSRLRHVELPFMDKNMRPYFKDVLDHVVRVNETIDGLARGVELRLRGGTPAGIVPPGRGVAQVRRLGCHPGGADRDRRDLRHELRVHARADLELRLFHRAGGDLRRSRHAVLAVPALGLAVTPAP